MNITIQGVCEFTWSPTAEHLAVLDKLSALHYDGTCRAASVHGGFIYGWRMQSECHVPEFGELRCRGNFHDFDTCLKIMENAGFHTNKDELALVRNMQSVFSRMLRRANQLYDIWREEIDV